MTAFGVSVATPLIFSLAGAGAGVTEAILVNPFEVVKVTLQSNRSKVKVIVLCLLIFKKILKSMNEFDLAGNSQYMGYNKTNSQNSRFRPKRLK